MDKSIYNGFENLEVEMISIVENPYELIWRWYRETWAHLHGKPFDEKDLVCAQAVSDVINGRALPTPLELLTFEFRVSGLSRVGLAQITRGRVGWAYNVLSQMPCPINHAVTIPKNIYEDPELGPEIRALTWQLQAFYDKAISRGVPPQDARYATLHGQQTSLVVGTNYASLKGFFTMRAENGLTDELNLVARKMRLAIIDYSFSEKGLGSGWDLLGLKLDCLGAKQEQCLIADLVFGATGRFPPGHKGVAVPAQDADRYPDNPVAHYDFAKSAWFLELLEMPQNLLLPSEWEMIERWKKNGGTSLLP